MRKKYEEQIVENFATGRAMCTEYASVTPFVMELLAICLSLSWYADLVLSSL